MANLTESINYDENVYQLETTDPVQGGANGVANAQAKALANRTAWLRKNVQDLINGDLIPAGVAKSNAQAFTGVNTVPTPAMGDRSLQIANSTFVQDTAHGTLTRNVGGNANVTLTGLEGGWAILVLTGALTGNIAVIVPSVSHNFVVDNRTTGAFTLTVKTAAGTGIAVRQGRRQALICDATNVAQATNDFTDTELSGAPTATSAAIGDNSTRVVNTALLQNTVGGVVSVPVGGGANVTLSQSQWGFGIILLTGVLTANIAVIFPTQNGRWIVCNKTTGNFSITLRTGAGGGQLIRQAESVVAYCDGSSIALAGATPAATFTVASFTATAGQTTFNVAYTPGNIMVMRNGAVLGPADFTATNGSSVVLATAALVNDQITIFAFASLVVANAVTQSFTDSRYALINNGTLNTPTVNSPVLNKPTIKGYIEQFQALNPGAAVTANPDNGTLIEIQVTANITITLPAAVAGLCYVLILRYQGAFTPTFAGGTELRWERNAAPAATRVSGRYDKYVFTCGAAYTLGQDGGRNF